MAVPLNAATMAPTTLTTLSSLLPFLGTQAPKLACYCDRYWAPLEDCRLPGAIQQRLPFLCPMDHVLDPIR